MHTENLPNDQNDEIDLLQILQNIWSGRLIIIFWVAFILLGVIGYLFVKEPVYRVEAIINQSQVADLIPIQPSLLNSGDVLSIPQLSEKTIYNSLLLQFSSINFLQSFWGEYSKNEKNKREFRAFADRLKIAPVNSKETEPSSRIITAEFEDPVKGAEVIDAYLSFLNTHVKTQAIENLKRSFEANLLAIDNNIALLEEHGQKKLSYDLIKLNENLTIAKSLRITATPYKDLENIGLNVLDGRDYLLGTAALELQINTLLARKGNSLRAYDEKINGLYLSRNIIESDIRRIDNFSGFVSMFKVEKRAEATLDPVKPKKIIFIIGALFFGFVLGCIHVLLAPVLKKLK